MFFREWCFGGGHLREIDTDKELIAIDQAKRDNVQKGLPTRLERYGIIIRATHPPSFLESCRILSTMR